MGNGKGDRRERELVTLLDSVGFAVIRAPASGSATPRGLSDVLAGNGEVIYAIEVKFSSGRPIYIDSAEVNELVSFAAQFGAAPRITVRFDTEAWAFSDPDKLHATAGGNYRVKRETAALCGADLHELAGESDHPRLDEFPPSA